ncbi:slipin family protein, partial [Candidatus Bathyarchaeota archaeon]|nr:slipin family protein [Candidatus Bathyarchaeota archaeon]
MVDFLVPFLGFVGLIVAIFFLSGIHVLKEWERMPILRLGRYIGLKGPG